MIELYTDKMGSRKEAHAYLNEVLSFPEYYGNNLDALFDVLTDIEAEVCFVGDIDEEGYAAKVLRVFRDAAKRNAGLIIHE